MDMIIIDRLPYAVVEGEAFNGLNFCDPLGPHRYRLKSEKICQNVACASYLWKTLTEIQAATKHFRFRFWLSAESR